MGLLLSDCCKVNGKTYGKLDMIGKGGSSRVYRVITPSNEIFALKRVSLDRTDQETMQVRKDR